MRRNLWEKGKEAMLAAAPIGAIILILNFTLVPLPGGTLALMLAGLVLLVVGLALFSLGTELAMMPMGEHIGSALIQSRKVPLLVIVLFLFGFIVTAAEPDLNVLAGQVASIPNLVLIIGIATGVGIFLVVAAFRILLGWKLSRMLLVFYPVVFLVAVFSSDYIAVAFDAAAVTTGPITVPFLLAIGSGFAAIVSKNSDEDNFGICAICSIGPILAVLLLGLFFDASDASFAQEPAQSVDSAGELVRLFANGLWHTLLDVLVVVVPIVAIFIIFQVVRLRLSKYELRRIFVGLGYLLVGLTVFLAGVNYGFMPAATYLGTAMGALSYNWILIPLSLVIGACVVAAEPAVHVLTRQVAEITSGAITRPMMLTGMMLGVGAAMSLAMVRMLFDISIWWLLLPGYAIALALTFFVPDIFVGIGFDSGGVAAGAMSAAFVLPFTIGVSESLGLNAVTGAFGVVGLIAMMPPITVQLMGVIYNVKLRRSARLEHAAEVQDAEETEGEDTL